MMDWRKILLSFWAWVNKPRVLQSRLVPIEEFFSPEQLAEYKAKFEGDIRKIVREEIEAAASKFSAPVSASNRLEGKTFDRKQVLALIAQINDAVRDGANLPLKPE